MSALKDLLIELVQVVITIFTGKPLSAQVIYQEVEPEWWKTKQQNRFRN